MVRFERSLTRIHQIEVTSRCNLRCKYCPYPKMQRLKADMSFDTFIRAVEWVRYFAGKGTQHDLSLCGLGEPLMHPDLIKYIEYLRENFNGDVHFGTNGMLLTEEIAEYLSFYRVGVFISLHRPELAAGAVNIARAYGILKAVNVGFAASSFDWAGKVKWEVTAPKIDCEYLKRGWGTILYDGKMTTCCMDTEDENIIGHINDPIGTLTTYSGSLCKACHHVVPKEMISSGGLLGGLTTNINL